MLKKLKSEKGIAWVDIEISFVVIIIFVALIGRMIYNIYYLRVVTQKQSVATAYQTQILEDIDAMAFESVTGNLTQVYDETTGRKVSIDEKYGLSEKGIWANIWIQNKGSLRHFHQPRPGQFQDERQHLRRGRLRSDPPEGCFPAEENEKSPPESERHVPQLYPRHG